MVLRNMFSMTGLNVAKAASAILVSTMMAGIVPPEQYGLVSFAIPLMAFISLLTDLGLTSAIVRHPDLTSEQAGGAVGILGLAGLLGGLVLAGSARPLEVGLHMAGLTPVLLGFSLVTAFSIWATAPRALLERRLAYPRIARTEIVALVAALAAFSAGLKTHMGILSLVAFHVVLQGIRAVAFFFSSRGFFRINFQYAGIKALAQVSGWVFLSNLLAYCARNVDRIVIGSLLGAASLGLYSLGYQFMTVPLVLITWPVSGVLLSTLARMGGDRARKADLVCAIITGTVAVSFPMMAFLMIGASWPVETLLSSRWHGVAEIIGILAPVGAVQSVAAYNGAVLIEKGAMRLNFYLALMSSVSLSGVFVLTVWMGLHSLVIAYAVVSVIVSLIMTYYMCKEAFIGAARFFSCLVPGTLASVVGTVAVAVAGRLSPHNLADWIVSVVVFAVAVLATFAVDRRRLLQCVRALTRASSAVTVSAG